MRNLMKLVTVIGARPQFVKAAVISRAIRQNGSFQEILLHSGQHYDENMSDIFFDEMEIPHPDHNLGVGSGAHGAQTGRMLEGIEKVLLQEKPDKVLVYGDTNSTLAGTLAAAKLHIPVYHLESGLRSFNRRMPEEINRIVADHLAERLYVPTETALKNLRKEGIDESRIMISGDVMYDAALFYFKKAQSQSKVLQQLGLGPKSYILSTIHRAENTDHPARLTNILEALAELNETVVLPLHPRTQAVIKKNPVLAKLLEKLRVIEPVGYLDMVMLEHHSKCIVTDSGGVQKEAFFFGVNCVTLRDETEWVELVQLGCNFLTPPLSKEVILRNTAQALATPFTCKAAPYGKGNAGEVIVADLAA